MHFLQKDEDRCMGLSFGENVNYFQTFVNLKVVGTPWAVAWEVPVPGSRHSRLVGTTEEGPSGTGSCGPVWGTVAAAGSCTRQKKAPEPLRHVARGAVVPWSALSAWEPSSGAGPGTWGLCRADGPLLLPTQHPALMPCRLRVRSPKSGGGGFPQSCCVENRVRLGPCWQEAARDLFS